MKTKKQIKEEKYDEDYERLCNFIMRKEKKKKPVYMWQCVKCREYMYSEETFLKHCGKLVQWISGIEGKGVNMNSQKVKIKVSGYIEMSQENLDIILGYEDVHTGLVYSVHMGYVDASHIEFITPE